MDNGITWGIDDKVWKMLSNIQKKEILYKEKEELRKALLQERWANKASRMETIMHLEEYNAHVLGRPIVPVEFTNKFSENQKGGYFPKENKIKLSEKLLLSDDMSDKYRIVEGIFHEGRHAYQRETFLHSSNYPNESNNNKQAWKEDQPSVYITADSEYNFMYVTQATERDNFKYAPQMTDDLFNCSTLETEKGNYREYRERNNQIFEYNLGIAKNRLGANYERKTDIAVKSMYLRFVAAKLMPEIIRKSQSGELTYEQYNKAKEINGELYIVIPFAIDDPNDKDSLKYMNDQQLRDKEALQRKTQQSTERLAKELNIDILFDSLNKSAAFVEKYLNKTVTEYLTAKPDWSDGQEKSLFYNTHYFQPPEQNLLESIAMRTLESGLFDFAAGNLYSDNIILQIGNQFYNTELEDFKAC